MELSNTNIKKVLIFSQENVVLIFKETKTPKNFLYFLERKLFVYFRKRKPRKNSLYFRKRNFLIFQERIFRALKIKRTHSLKSFLFFREIKLSNLKLKKLLMFQKGTYKPLKTIKKSALKKLLVSCDVFVIFLVVKHKEIISGNSLVKFPS